MVKFTYAIAFLFLFISCNQEIENEHIKNLEEKQSNQSEIEQVENNEVPEIKTSEFNQSNIEEKLTQYGEKNPENIVLIKTSLGNMKLKLYENTPLHRANFIRLAKMDFYDSTIFYRVVKDFMIQGGVKESSDEDIETLKKKVAAGSYRIPSEINDENFHQAGAIAMANNSSFEEEEDKKNYSSEPYNFYIVTGKRLSNYQLKRTEEEYGLSIPSSRKKVYQSKGGTPHLDGDYTVFGQVISGMSVLRKISNTEVDKYEWPVEDVVIYSIEVVE